ncbi:Peroxiredoxin [Thauera chlorobenzoica]|nr:Peroxiredoxin [Thauera chlorobenzoica]
MSISSIFGGRWFGRHRPAGGRVLAMGAALLLAIAAAPVRAAQAAVADGALGSLVEVEGMPQAPEFELSDTEGKRHRLSAYRGKVVVVNFWSVWCAPCRKEMPAMQRAWEQIRDRDVLILAVNFDDRPEQVSQFFSVIPVQFPVLLGGDRPMLKAWSVHGLPTTYVLDPQGRLRHRVVGEYHWDQPEALELLLGLRGK